MHRGFESLPLRLLAAALLLALLGAPPAAAQDTPAFCAAAEEGSAQYPHWCERVAPPGEVRGAVLVLHGGAWLSTGREKTQELRPVAERLAAQGYEAYLVDYAPGGPESVDAVRRAHDLLRAARPGLPLCAWGESAGGHLALMLARQRRGLRCAVGVAAPTDLAAIPDRGSYAFLHDLARDLFGPEPGPLHRWSPARDARRIRARVLLAFADEDPVVPRSQGRRFVRARPKRTELVPLRDGEDGAYVHGRCAAGSLARLYREERELLRRAARPR